MSKSTELIFDIVLKQHDVFSASKNKFILVFFECLKFLIFFLDIIFECIDICRRCSDSCRRCARSTRVPCKIL